MKKPLFVLLPFFLLSACTMPGAEPTVVARTAIVQTMTAFANQYTGGQGTETPPPPADATGTTVPDASLPTPTTVSAVFSPTAVPETPVPLYSPVPPLPAASTWDPYYADQFIYYYFQHINNRDYTTTWSLLTDAFKAAVNPDGYGGYTAFWNTVQRVDVHYVYLNYFDGYFANVSVDMTYNYYNGTVVRTVVPFRLAYNVSRVTWMFDVYSPVPSTPVPSYYGSPNQFIYHYFYNINLRNYGYTWSLLTPAFMAANNPSGYDDYAAYWNTINRVDVTYVTINSHSGDVANVTAGLRFTKTDSTVVTVNLTYNLLYNHAINNWQFHTP